MKILVYDDSPDFGGHQIMACHGIEALADIRSIDIVCMINPKNKRLAERLSGMPTLSTPCTIKTLRDLTPDLVLCIQGDIAQSAPGITAALHAGITCLSYIAITHRKADMGAKFGAFRDQLHQPLINKPDRFITISQNMKQRLTDRGCSKPVNVVHNGIPVPESLPRRSQSASPVIGLIGRMEFHQKQQDFMLRTFCSYPEFFRDCRLLFIGDGPDMDRLMKLTEGKDNVTVLPWQDDMNPVYEQIDWLIIPSRYEGVSLVMLEALARGIPVIGSACDGMKEVLPENWLFEPEDGQALGNTFCHVQQTWQNQIAEVQHKVRAGYSLDAFKSNFVQAVTGS